MVDIYNFENGKYRVERNTDTCEVKIYRNDERWNNMESELQHSKFFHSMLNKIDELQHKVFYGCS